MVAGDDSVAYLLRGSLGKCRSDDNGDELIVVTEVPNALVEKSPNRRARILGRMRQKVANRVRSKGKKKKSPEEDEDKENVFSGTPSPAATNLSSYDERSILERREGPPDGDDELLDTLSTVSSVFSTESNQKSQRRLIDHWKSCMSFSVRKRLRKDIEDEMKGKPARYHDFGLYIFPEDSKFRISKDRKRSAFDLLLPTLETPPASQDEASNAGQYNNEDDFPLKSLDAIAVEEATLQKEITAKRSEPQRSFLQPKKSNHNLFVSFDEDMAQLIFDVPSSDTEDFQAVDVQSVVSDIDGLSDEEGDPFIVTFPSYMAGAATYRNLGLPTIAPSASGETEGSARPLGITCGHPYAHRQNVDTEVWSNVEAPLMDGEVTDPPSPIPVNKSREDYWTLGQVYSNESDLTMTDVLLNKHGCFPTDFPSALPEMPAMNLFAQNYPFDEEPEGDERENFIRRRPEAAVSTGIEHYLHRGTVPEPAVSTGTERYLHRGTVPEPAVETGIERYWHRGTVPYDEDRDERESRVRRRPDQAASNNMAHFLQRGALAAFAADRDEEHHGSSIRDHVRREKVKCGCVKCTAKSIYQDLLQCNGGR
eukprot:CAMPEP_0119030422 /NCGR_PEP_ID=MMETSP1176-20130426/41020_1 /TAXON_ID=265551 /ORGANISM="Synedropsis recta cf, Strain CCMP1620" /LENGTH=593 /DNA_ID=CAMNT_0006986793 /DNA_START=136 /DNA_END=1917 /DNA_ORIENTATION=+